MSDLIKIDDLVSAFADGIKHKDPTPEQSKVLEVFANEVRALDRAEKLVKEAREKLTKLMLDNYVESYRDTVNGILVSLTQAYTRSSLDTNEIKNGLFDWLRENFNTYTWQEKELFMQQFTEKFSKEVDVKASVRIKAE